MCGQEFDALFWMLFVLAGGFAGALIAIALLLFTNAGWFAVIPVLIGCAAGAYVWRDW